LREDDAIAELCLHSLQNFVQLFGNAQFDAALESLWETVRALNRYVDRQAPWTLYKQGSIARLATVTYVLLTAMRKTALCLWPVMPDASRQMLEQLGSPAAETVPPVTALGKEGLSFDGLSPGTIVAGASNLFPRIDTKRDTAPKMRSSE
jgi:methionyl-tRNA synthetase